MLRNLATMFVLLVCALWATQAALARARAEQEVCQSASKQLHVAVSKYDPTTQQDVLCRGTVTTRYCIGSCASRAYPTLRYESGFAKRCSCCMESSIRVVEVYLPDCSDGNRRVVHGRYFNMREPQGCTCQNCGP